MLDKDKISLSRVSRDGRKNIVSSDGKYLVLSSEDNSILETHTSLTPIVASGLWRRATSDEKQSFMAPVVAAGARDFEPTITEQETDLLLADELAEEVEDDIYDFNIDYDFYATPFDAQQNQHDVTGVYAMDPDSGELYWWEDGEFQAVNEDDLDPALPETWVLIDSDTAQFIADWQDHRLEDEMFCTLHDADPAEKAMFDAAEAGVDWEFIKTLSAVVADASGYSPQERSQNASKQRRGPGGRFARQPGEGNGAMQPDSTTRAPSIIKSYIPAKRDIVLIPNPLNFIVDFIGTASPSSAPGVGGGVVASGEEQIVSEEAQKATREVTTPSSDTIYFAMVDKDDNRAVQGLLAITKDENGKPQAWNRNMGEWKPSPDALADLQSITPPPVVKLEEEDVKTVLDGIDEYDKQGDSREKPDAVQAEEVAQASLLEDVRKGYALEDGSFRIKTVEDMFSAVQAAPEDASDAVKAHIIKRARAFNRMDIVPEEWRTYASLSQSPLFNSYGDVIIAAGNRGGNEETLKQYWGSGKGAAKIRWGSEGDLSRCHKHLTKYIGSEDAWGFCQNLHMKKYGKSNYKKDNGK